MPYPFVGVAQKRVHQSQDRRYYLTTRYSTIEERLQRENLPTKYDLMQATNRSTKSFIHVCRIIGLSSTNFVKLVLQSHIYSVEQIIYDIGYYGFCNDVDDDECNQHICQFITWTGDFEAIHGRMPIVLKDLTQVVWDSYEPIDTWLPPYPPRIQPRRYCKYSRRLYPWHFTLSHGVVNFTHF